MLLFLYVFMANKKQLLKCLQNDMFNYNSYLNQSIDQSIKQISMRRASKHDFASDTG